MNNKNNEYKIIEHVVVAIHWNKILMHVYLTYV